MTFVVNIDIKTSKREMHRGTEEGIGLSISCSQTDNLMRACKIFHEYYKMAFMQIPHSALPEKNSKDPPHSVCSMKFY